MSSDLDYLNSITVDSLVDLMPRGDSRSVFTFLRDTFHHEFYGAPPSQPMLVASKVFTALVALLLAANLVVFAIRIWRGDRQFYKLFGTPHGTFIIPNVLNNFLFWNSIYMICTFPFVWTACLRQDSNLHNKPLWKCLFFIPLFFALWSASWGATVAAFLQSTRLNNSDNAQQQLLQRRSMLVSPMIVNLFFVAVMLIAPGAMIGITVGATQKYNRGISVYYLFDAELLRANLSQGAPGGDAQTVLSAIPNAETWTHALALDLGYFELPFGVCVTFAGLAGLVMLCASLIQIRTLSAQISYLKKSIAGEKQNPLEAPSLSSSTKSTVDLHRKSGLIRVLRTVIATSIGMTLAAGAYMSACVIGQERWNVTPVFHLYKDGIGHLYVFLYVYAIIDLAVTLLVISQTFDPAANPGRSRPRFSISFGSSKDCTQYSASLPAVHYDPNAKPQSPVSPAHGGSEWMAYPYPTYSPTTPLSSGSQDCRSSWSPLHSASSGDSRSMKQPHYSVVQALDGSPASPRKSEELGVRRSSSHRIPPPSLVEPPHIEPPTPAAHYPSRSPQNDNSDV